MKHLALFSTLLCLLVSFSWLPVQGASGDLDPTFGDNGKVTTDIHFNEDWAKAVAVDSQNRVVVAGFSGAGDWNVLVARYTSNGALDGVFGSGGYTLTPVGGGNDYGMSVWILPGDDILVGGFVDASGGVDSRFLLIRYRSTGLVDTTFGTNGIVLSEVSNTENQIEHLVLQPDGKILAFGHTGRESDNSQKVAVVRWNADGSLDTGFGNNGVFEYDFFYQHAKAWSGAVRADGKILIAGQGFLGANQAFVAQIEADGAIDFTFGLSGIAQAPAENTSFYDLAVQDNGAIVAVGGAVNDAKFYLVRFLENGELDTALSATGSISLNAWDGAAHSLAVDPDGNYVLAGQVQGTLSKDVGVSRLLPSGQLDSGFGNGGEVVFDNGMVQEEPPVLAIHDNGKLLVASSTLVAGSRDLLLLRYELGSTAPPAGSLKVNTQSDEVINDGKCSLREAIQAAEQDVQINECPAGQSGGDLIVFDAILTGKTITLSSPLVVNTEVELQGNGVQLSGQNLTRVLDVNAAKVSLKDFIISDGKVGGNENGAGLLARNGAQVELRNVSFVSNHATDTGDGGALAALDTNTTVTVIQSVFRDNTAMQGGGAARVRDEATLTVEDSVFDNNTIPQAFFQGGAVAATNGATFNAKNSLFHANRSGGNGGAVYLQDASATLQHNTFHANGSDDPVGTLFAENATLTLYNNLLANTTSASECEVDSATTLTAGANLMEGGGCNATLNADPNLLEIPATAGQFTLYTPASNSPAVDAGDSVNCLALDYVGAARPQGNACDLGYLESTFNAPPPQLRVTTTSEAIAVDGACSLGEAVQAAKTDAAVNECPGGKSGSDTITFDPALANQTLVLTAPLVLDTPLTLDGEGHNVTLSGQNQTRLLDITSPDVTVKNLTLTQGSRGQGGAMQIAANNTRLENLGFLNNEASDTSGGALYLAADAEVVASQLVMRDNRAQESGGAIWLEGGARLTLENSILANNQSSTLGGGAIGAADGATLTVVNTTLADNQAQTRGGAILADSATLRLVHNSLGGNTAPNPGSSVHVTGTGALTLLHNLMLAANGTTPTCAVDATASLVREGPNFIQDGSCDAVLSGDPVALPKTNNGLITHFAPQAGSPLVAAANGDLCPPVDQFGATRPQGGGCDLGSVETALTRSTTGPLVVNTVADSVAGDGKCSLREAVQAADTDLAVEECPAGQAGHDTIVFDPALADQTIVLTSLLQLQSALTLDGEGLNLTLSGEGQTPLLSLLSSDISLKNLTLANGKLTAAVKGAAVKVTVGKEAIHLENLRFLNNTAQSNTDEGHGGALSVAGSASVTGVNLWFQGNRASRGGGAVWVEADGALTVDNSVFVDNETFQATSEGGGAIEVLDGGHLTVRNSTFAGNHVNGGPGGGIFAQGATLALHHNTFGDNTATLAGTAIATVGATTLDFTHNLLTASGGLDACVTDATTTLNADGPNHVEDGTCGASQSGDPLLLAVTQNGATNHFEPQNGSLVIDAATGTCLATDQRGIARPQGNACDLGSIETSNTPGTPTKPPSLPLAPTQLRITTEPTAMVLTWQDTSDNEDAFHILRDGQVLAQTGPDVTAYRDGDIQCASEHTYAVRAANGLGAGDAAQLVATTADCPSGEYFPHQLTVNGEGTVARATPNPVAACDPPADGCQGYIRDSQITWAAVPATGWLFDQWTDDCRGMINPAEFSADRARSCGAIFLPAPGGGNATGYVAFQPNGYQVAENAGAVSLTLTREGGDVGSLTVTYATQSALAEAGRDFRVTQGELTWGHGDSEPKRITVPLIDDAVFEGNQDFAVLLNGDAQFSAKVVILENDPPPGSKLIQDQTILTEEENVVLAGQVQNQSTVKDAVIATDAVAEGGEFSGVIENQGTLKNAYVTAGEARGGKLSGDIHLAAVVTVRDVQLDDDTRIIGGNLAGSVTGSKTRLPRLLGQAEIQADTVLEDVEISPSVVLKPGVRLGKNVLLPPSNPQPETYGLNRDTLPFLTADRVRALNPLAFSTLTAADVALIPASAMRGVDYRKLAELSKTALPALSADQLAEIPLEALKGLHLRNLGGLPGAVIEKLTTPQWQGITAVEMQNLEDRELTRVMVYLDPAKIPVDQAKERIRADWDIDADDREVQLPPNTPFVLRRKETTSVADVTLNDIPDLDTGLAQGGQAPTSMREDSVKSIQTLNLPAFALNQGNEGVVRFQLDQDPASGLAFVPLSESLVQLPAQAEPGVSTDAGGFTRITTAKRQQYTVAPAPKNFAAMAKILGRTVESRPDGSIKLGDFTRNRRGRARSYLMFDPLIEPPPADYCVASASGEIRCDFTQAQRHQLPGLHLPNPNSRRIHQVGRMVFDDGSSQQVRPTVAHPGRFITQARQFPGVEEAIYTAQGDFQIRFMGAQLYLVPSFTNRVYGVSAGTQLRTQIEVTPQGTVRYTTPERELPVGTFSIRAEETSDMLEFELAIQGG